MEKKYLKHFTNSYILTLILQESEITRCILVFLDLKKFNDTSSTNSQSWCSRAVHMNIKNMF